MSSITVKKLIEILSEFSPDMPVVLDGYEGGVYECRLAHQVKVALNYHDKKNWWYGPHELTDRVWEEDLPLLKTIDAVRIC